MKNSVLPSVSTPGPVLELDRVAIGYGREPVVSDVSFVVAAGEFVTLLGPSGSGKTSLLRAIAGFVPVTNGDIRLQGRPMAGVPPYERDIAVVFQNYALFPHMTVVQNLAFGPRTLGLPKAEIARRAQQVLRQVRLEAFGDRYPHELSGGQQQRVAIARALAMQPALLLLDEPMSNLDARLRAQMRIELIDLLKSLSVTAISVTHDQDEALAMSDRIVVMAEGGVRQIGTPGEIYQRPIDPFVAGFVGDANVIRATCRGEVHEGLARFDTEWGHPLHVRGCTLRADDAGLLLVRPEAITLPAGASGMPADAQAVEPNGDLNQLLGVFKSRAYMGATSEIRVTLHGEELLVRLPASHDRHDLVPGDSVCIQWDAAAVRAIRR